MLGGALAGVGGAFLTLSHTNLFVEGMVAGRGFIALAVVVFGRWKPWGVFGASLLFGVFYAPAVAPAGDDQLGDPVPVLAGPALRRHAGRARVACAAGPAHRVRWACPTTRGDHDAASFEHRAAPAHRQHRQVVRQGRRQQGRVSFDVRPGEIHCLLGENGAGKTVLMSILYGMYQPDSGTHHVQGQAARDSLAQRRHPSPHRHGPPALHARAHPHRRGEHRPGAAQAVVRAERHGPGGAADP